MILINNYTIMTKLICDKHDMVLKKDKKIHLLSIEFEIKNPNIIIPDT